MSSELEARARHLIRQRVTPRAHHLGVPAGFLLRDLGWELLIPRLALMLEPGALCECGREFRQEREVTLDHREPPRHRQDWARHNVANIAIACGPCNYAKGARPFSEWLDLIEERRLGRPAELWHPTLFA